MKQSTLQLRDSLATDLHTWRKCAIEAKAKANARLSVYNYRGMDIYENECDRYVSMFHALVMFACSSGIITDMEQNYLFDGLQREINTGRIYTEYYRVFVEREAL